jgi:hypothetical protein
MFYRAYLVGCDDGIVGSVELLDCDNDQQALSQAGAVHSWQCMIIEVWQAVRLVGRVRPSRSRKRIEPEFMIEDLTATGATFALYDTKDRLLAFSPSYVGARGSIGGAVDLGISWLDLIHAASTHA